LIGDLRADIDVVLDANLEGQLDRLAWREHRQQRCRARVPDDRAGRRVEEPALPDRHELHLGGERVAHLELRERLVGSVGERERVAEAVAGLDVAAVRIRDTLLEEREPGESDGDSRRIVVDRWGRRIVGHRLLPTRRVDRGLVCDLRTARGAGCDAALEDELHRLARSDRL